MSHDFLVHLQEELAARGESEALGLLGKIQGDPDFRAALDVWSSTSSTIDLREACRGHGSYWEDLDFSNAVDAIDAAVLRVPDRIEAVSMTPIQRLAIDLGSDASLVRGDDLSAAYAFCAEAQDRMDPLQIQTYDAAIADLNEDLSFDR